MAVKRTRAAAFGAMLALLAASAANANKKDAPTDAAVHAAITGDLEASLTAQAEVIGSSHGLVADKKSLRREEFATRVRAAYKLLRAGETPFWIDEPDPAKHPARLGAIRRILMRDRAELTILDEELASLEAARAANETQRASLATVKLPLRASLARPVPGAIIRQLGTYRHDASKATLSRRGLEFDAPAGQRVTSPIDGTVTFVGAVRDLETVVVIKSEDTVVVLGRLRAAEVVKGEQVAARQALGEATGRRLYCEVRLALGGAGLPVDPTDLFERR